MKGVFASTSSTNHRPNTISSVYDTARLTRFPKAMYRCNICNVISRDLLQHDKHLEGKRHRTNAQIALGEAPVPQRPPGGAAGQKRAPATGGAAGCSKRAAKAARRHDRDMASVAVAAALLNRVTSDPTFLELLLNVRLDELDCRAAPQRGGAQWWRSDALPMEYRDEADMAARLRPLLLVEARATLAAVACPKGGAVEIQGVEPPVRTPSADLQLRLTMVKPPSSQGLELSGERSRRCEGVWLHETLEQRFGNGRKRKAELDASDGLEALWALTFTIVGSGSLASARVRPGTVITLRPPRGEGQTGIPVAPAAMDILAMVVLPSLPGGKAPAAALEVQAVVPKEWKLSAGRQVGGPGMTWRACQLASVVVHERMYEACRDEVLDVPFRRELLTPSPADHRPPQPLAPASSITELNECQLAAASSFLQAVRRGQDHSGPPSTPSMHLVQGPPGTGKTSMLVWLLAQLGAAAAEARASGAARKVVVCAPSNKAVQLLCGRFVAAHPGHAARTTLIAAGGEDEHGESSTLIERVGLHGWVEHRAAALRQLAEQLVMARESASSKPIFESARQLLDEMQQRAAGFVASACGGALQVLRTRLVQLWRRPRQRTRKRWWRSYN
ncbi:hypothetical protein CYMTET_28845, partial [Cymbomonas tetramitiformis]